jgi:hypothetical protein
VYLIFPKKKRDKTCSWRVRCFICLCVFFLLMRERSLETRFCCPGNRRSQLHRQLSAQTDDKQLGGGSFSVALAQSLSLRPQADSHSQQLRSVAKRSHHLEECRAHTGRFAGLFSPRSQHWAGNRGRNQSWLVVHRCGSYSTGGLGPQSSVRQSAQSLGHRNFSTRQSPF